MDELHFLSSHDLFTLNVLFLYIIAGKEIIFSNISGVIKDFKKAGFLITSLNTYTSK